MKSFAIGVALFAALAVTRWMLAPPYLFYLDNINFALAVRGFNIALHQPHPPGYPLYVALLKALGFFIPSAKYVQLAAGAIGSLAALCLIRELGARMFGSAAGWLAAAILILQPSFWLAGIGNQVRTFLAAGGVAVALCVWRAWQRREPATRAELSVGQDGMRRDDWQSPAGPIANRPADYQFAPHPKGFHRIWRTAGSWRRAGEPVWEYAAAAALGVAAGFRPDLLVLLFPLFAAAVFPAMLGRRAKPASYAPAMLALAILATTSAAWIAVIVWKSGGLAGCAEVFLRQWRTSSAHTTILGGASPAENLRTAARSAYWYGVGTLAWIWAVPFAWKKLRWRDAHAQIALLAWWGIPAFLFHAVVFVHDPDTTLDASPALALLGAWVLAQLPRPWLAAVTAMGIQAAIFAASPLQGGKDASYAWVKRVGTETASVIDQIRALPGDQAAGGETVVVTNRSLVTVRQIQYYFPQLRIVNVDADLRRGCPEGPELELPRASHLLWLAPVDGSAPMDSSLRSVAPGSKFLAGSCQVVAGTGDR